MSKKGTATIDDVLSWKPCVDYDRGGAAGMDAVGEMTTPTPKR